MCRGRVLLLLSLSAVGQALAAIPPSERDALISLYTSTAGAGWAVNTGWLGVPGTECTWYGITCNMDETNVIGVSLTNDNLVGTIPPEIGQLTQLRSLLLPVNQLSGSIPTTLTSISTLSVLVLTSNRLSGSIPTLGNWPHLSNLALDSNQLTGSIPSLALNTDLFGFSVHDNLLTGPLPSLSGLSILQSFDVSYNYLTGSIPALTGLSALHRYRIAHNELHGILPDPPAPNNLMSSLSSVCPNSLDPIDNAQWDTATGFIPWYAPCDPIFASGLE